MDIYKEKQTILITEATDNSPSMIYGTDTTYLDVDRALSSHTTGW